MKARRSALMTAAWVAGIPASRSWRQPRRGSFTPVPFSSSKAVTKKKQQQKKKKRRRETMSIIKAKGLARAKARKSSINAAGINPWLGCEARC
jgi:hypothetical protein